MKRSIVNSARWFKVKLALMEVNREVKIMRMWSTKPGGPSITARWDDAKKKNVTLVVDGEEISTRRLSLLAGVPDLSHLLAPLATADAEGKIAAHKPRPQTEFDVAKFDTTSQTVGQLPAEMFVELMREDESHDERMEDMIMAQGDRLGKLEKQMQRLLDMIGHEATK